MKKSDGRASAGGDKAVIGGEDRLPVGRRNQSLLSIAFVRPEIRILNGSNGCFALRGDFHSQPGLLGLGDPWVIVRRKQY
jgi:hypothetical protein